MTFAAAASAGGARSEGSALRSRLECQSSFLPWARTEKSPVVTTTGLLLAEPEFEPSMRLYTPYSLSRGAPSATRSQFLKKPRLCHHLGAQLVEIRRFMQRSHGQFHIFRRRARGSLMISLVEIIWMLMPSSAQHAEGILLATPTWLHMPDADDARPCRVFVSPTISVAPENGHHLRLQSRSIVIR